MSRALIDVHGEQLTLWANEKVGFTIYQTKKFPKNIDTYHKVKSIHLVVRKKYKKELFDDLLEQYIVMLQDLILLLLEVTQGAWKWLTLSWDLKSCHSKVV